MAAQIEATSSDLYNSMHIIDTQLSLNIITKHGKDKNTGTLKERTPKVVKCANGFGPLGDLNASLVIHDGDPC